MFLEWNVDYWILVVCFTQLSAKREKFLILHCQGRIILNDAIDNIFKIKALL